MLRLNTASGGSIATNITTTGSNDDWNYRYPNINPGLGTGINVPPPITTYQYPTLVVTAICMICGKWLGEEFTVKRGTAYCGRRCLKEAKIREVQQKLDR